MGKFELKKASNGEFMFNLLAANGQVILTSETYKAKDSAQNGIESVRKNAPMKDRFEPKVSSNEKHYFVLKAGNHEVIGKSEMYNSESARDAGMESVMDNAPDAGVDDQTH